MRNRLVPCRAVALTIAAVSLWLPGALFASPGDAFADRVANVTGTFGHCCGALSSDPLVAAPLVLGAPDASVETTANFIQISDGASITLVFVDNVALANGSTAKADLRIHTYDVPFPSAATIEVSVDGVTFYTLPAPPLNDPGRFCLGSPLLYCNYDDNPAGYIDLDFDSVGLGYVTHVRLTDLTADVDGETGYLTLGFDLDAVEALWPGPETCLIPPPGLVSWWPGDADASDVAGENHGLPLDDATYAPGKVGLAFRFDGADDGVQVADHSSLDFGPGVDFSIDAWVAPIRENAVQIIVDKRHAPPPPNQAVGYALFLYEGRIGFQMADAPLTPGAYTNFISAGPSLLDGAFHHVAATVDRDAPGGGKLFVDGVVVLTFDPAVEPGDLSNDEPFLIGKHATPTYPGDVTGLVDEVEVFNRALSEAEIQALYLRGSAGKCRGCTYTLGFWKNHPGDWPVSSLTLGSVTYGAADLLRVLNQPVKGNGLVSLAHQLIAAKLNVAAGASGPTGTIADADALIGTLVVPPVGVGWLAPAVTGPTTFVLDQYNKGLLGPPHCED